MIILEMLINFIGKVAVVVGMVGNLFFGLPFENSVIISLIGLFLILYSVDLKVSEMEVKKMEEDFWDDMYKP